MTSIAFLSLDPHRRLYYADAPLFLQVRPRPKYLRFEILREGKVFHAKIVPRLGVETGDRFTQSGPRIAAIGGARVPGERQFDIRSERGQRRFSDISRATLVASSL